MKKLRTLLIVLLLLVAGTMLRVSTSYSQAGVKEVPPTWKQYEMQTANVWVEVQFIQLDKIDMDEVEKEIGFTLTPPDGKLILSPQEKSKLLEAITAKKNAETIGTASLVTLSGQQVQMQTVEQIRYPTEFSAPEKEEKKTEERIETDAKPIIVPATFETRNVGIIFNATPTISRDRKTITLAIAPEASILTGWIDYGSAKASQPVFSSWSLTTTISMPDNTSFVIKGMPGKSFEDSYVLNRDVAKKRKGDKVSLIIISAKIVDVSQNETKPKKFPIPSSPQKSLNKLSLKNR